MATRYWVGGNGSWNTTTNWSATSGGAGGASIPISTDDVIFDANSGLTGGAVSTCDIAFTINNLTITPNATTGINYLFITVSLTINGTMSCSATAGNRRLWIRSSNYGIGVNLTIATASSLADLDFRDIYVKGTAAPINGTRIGNNGNCTGITFSAPKTVYWNLAGSQLWISNGWAATSGGTPADSNFPLAQDTAVFDNAGSITTLNINNTTPYVPTVNFSTRTSSITLILSSSTIVYGNWSNGSGVTLSGTNTLTFAGGTTQTITSAGIAFTCPITVNTYGGTVQLADALNIGTNALNVTNGTFNTQGYAVTASTLSSTNSNVRAIYLGASTYTCTSFGVAFGTATNLTFNAGTSTIVFSGASGGITAGLPFTFYNVVFNNTSAVLTFSIGTSGATLTYNNLTLGAPGSTGIFIYSFASNQTINGTLTCSGASAVRRVFLQSDTVGTQRTLTVNSLSADDCDFRDIAITGTAAGTSPTRAGDCGNNSGITFPAPKTVYWNLAGSQNWSATGWATSSGGTPAVNNFPLAQDTAVFDNTGSAGTVQFNMTWNIGTFDASGRTSAMTFGISSGGPSVYGDWKFGTGVTSAVSSLIITFSKNGTQTITSNGVQFGYAITINNPNAYVQLADALSLNSARTLTLTAGTFDAVTYNVTMGAFSNGSTSNTLKMGSGTWTLSGTGTVWSVVTTPILIAGTSTIVLSDTSTTARTFTSSTTAYYNKVTIGGSTGTSTTTFNNGGTYGELASTKTVAHTIVLGSSQTFNIGKWSVTGTVGNVVTLAPSTAATTYTINIYGPANTGIDYLSVSYCSVSTTSPGELYVGANSTNTAGNTGPIFFTATPSPRTLYWVGGTGNWSATTSWSTSSGGASGAAIPTSLDSVNFNSLSNATAYTATIDAGITIARCAAFTMAGPLTGNVTFAGTVLIAYHGNVSFAATGITRSYTGAMNLVGNSSYTFTTNGLALASLITVNGIGSTWSLGSALSIGTGNVAVTYGTFSTSASNYALSCQAITASNSNVRSIVLNGSTITFAFATSQQVSISTITNLTFNAGTSNIVSSGTVGGHFTGGLTFYNVSFTNAAATSISFTGSGANTFNNLTFTGLTSVGINAVTFSANQTINGTLTLGAGTAASYRTFLASDTIGTTRTLTVNALAAGAADIDFRDITIAGAATPISGTRFGDCKGNSGITFDAAKTVYYRQTGSSNWGTSGSGSWSATSGGAFDATMFPLAQDTAVFPAATYPASGSTTTINANYNIGTIDMSLRTSNTMTLATGTTTPQIYGNWINGTGITFTGTVAITFAGRGSQAITSAGVTFTQPITVNSPSGTVTLQNNFATSVASANAVLLTSGTFDANGYNVTLSGASSGVNISGAITRTLAVGSGTWTIAGTGGWVATTANNLTVTGTGTISLTSASAKTFAGGGVSYSGITLNQGGAGTLTISGNNTFANITNTYGSTGATTINLAATTQTVGAWTAKGTAGNLLTITGTSAASPATLIYSGGGVISGVDYVVPTFMRAYPTTATWYVGSNSTNGGSLGFIFAPYVPPSTGINGQFFAFF